MSSDFYWDKFAKTGKVSDYLSYRYPDPAIIKHHPKEGAAHFPHNGADGDK